MIPGCLAALLIFGFPSVFMAGYLAALEEDDDEGIVPKPGPEPDRIIERGDS